MGCAGIIIGGIGIGGALFVDAVTFLVSGLLLLLLKVNEENREKQRFRIKGYVGTLKEGFTYFKTSELAMMVCVICVAQNLCTLPIENLQAAYISEYLRLDVFAMSVGGTAITIGMISGALILPAVSQRISEKQVLIGGGVLIGLLYFAHLLIGAIPSDEGKYLGYFIAAFAFGVVNSVIGVTVQVIFVSRVPEDIVGRISGIFNALACASLPVGSFLLAGLSAVFAIRELYLLTGILSIVLFLLMNRNLSSCHFTSGMVK